MQRWRNREWRACHPRSQLLQRFGIHDRLRYLLKKEGYAITSLDYFSDQIARQRHGLCGKLSNQGLAIGSTKAIKAQHSDVRLICPWGREFRAGGRDQKDRKMFNLPDEKIQQLQRCRIDPVQV